MIEVLKSFERAAGGLSPIVLATPGLLLIVLGLFVWLGGLGFRRIVLAVVGVAVGVVCGLCIGRGNGVVVILSALIAGFAGAFLQRPFNAMLLGVLAFVAVFVFVARPVLGEYRGTLIAGRQASHNDEKLTIRQSLDVVHATTLDLADSVTYAARRLAPLGWALAAGAGVGLLSLGLLARRLSSALACALLGTAAVFMGLVLLLMLKGSSPVTRIESRAAFYGLVFTGMTTFGTLEQLVLYRRCEPGKARAKPGKAPPNEGPSKRSWRNR